MYFDKKTSAVALGTCGLLIGTSLLIPALLYTKDHQHRLNNTNAFQPDPDQAQPIHIGNSIESAYYVVERKAGQCFLQSFLGEGISRTWVPCTKEVVDQLSPNDRRFVRNIVPSNYATVAPK